MSFFEPEKGEHLSVIAPTGGGKTTLLGQLLAHQPTDQLTIIFDTKPRNTTLDVYMASMKPYRNCQYFPPPFPSVTLKYYRTWRIRHAHSGVPEQDKETLRETVSNALSWIYINAPKYGGARIVFDEVLDFTRAGLGDYVEMILTHGRSQDCSLWSGTQRPRKVPLEMYSQATHLFLGCTPDSEDRKRYAEIGGVDPNLVKDLTATLPKYHFLYLCRSPQSGAIIEA